MFFQNKPCSVQQKRKSPEESVRVHETEKAVAANTAEQNPPQSNHELWSSARAVGEDVV